MDTLPMLMSWSSVGLRFGSSTESLEDLCKITVWHYQGQQKKLFSFIALFSKDEIWAGKSLHLEMLLIALKEIRFDLAVPWTSDNHMLTVLRIFSDLNFPLFSRSLPTQTQTQGKGEVQKSPLLPS